MSRKLTAVAALVAIAATLATIAAAAPAGAKQRVSIAVTGAGSKFALTALTAGAIKSDTGVASFCCWTQRFITRDGQSIELNNPQMTLTGKRGTIVARNQIGWIDIPDGWGVFTGTWTVIRGTGAYAGLAGGGRGAGVMFNSSETKATFEGFLNPK